MDESADTSGAGSEREARLAKAIASYVERIEAGEEITPDEVHRDHPDLAREILKELSFIRSFMGRSDRSPRRTTFGDYILIHKIGQGGMGAVVYEALQVSVDRKVALKVLSPFWADDPKVARQFIREAQIAAQLSHPHVVPVFGAGIEDGIPYYAMELVLGETLAARIRRARVADGQAEGEPSGSLLPSAGPSGEATLSIRGRVIEDRGPPGDPISHPGPGMGLIGYRESLEVALAFAGAADGLQHAHEKQVIHRDIKPSNLIFDPDGRLRILDFGLARLVGQESLDASGRIAGTLPYMSPEQARPRKGGVDHRTDIYSMGATLYEVLTLKPPVTGESHGEVLDGIANREPVRPRRLNPRIHKHLEAIVLKCLRKSPRERYPTAAALARDLRLFASGEIPDAPLPSILERAARAAWKRKLLLSAVASILLLVSTLGAYLHLKARQDLQREDAEYNRRVVNVLFDLQGELYREALTAGDRGSVFQDEFFGLLGPALRGSGIGFGTVEESVEVLEGIVGDFPRRSDASYHLARAYEHLGERDKATDALDEALRRDRNFLPALLLRASLSEEGAGRGEEIIAKHGGSEWARAWFAARRASEERNWKATVEHLGAAIAAAKPEEPYAGAAPERPKEPYVGALLEMRLERAMMHVRPPADSHLAFGDLVLVSDQSPEAVEPALLKAVACYKMGRKDLAESTFESIYESARSPDAAALWIAGTYFTLAPSAESIPFWLDKVKKERLRDMGYFVLHCWKEPYEMAVELGKKIIGEDPGAAARIHSSLGWPLNFLGRYREAAKHAELALEADHDIRWARMHLGKALFFMGQKEKARAMFDEELQLKLQRGNPWVPAFAGGHLIEAGFIEDGLSLAREAVAIDENLARAWRYVGDAHYYMERFLDAKEAFEKVAELDPTESPVLRLSLACALSKLGRGGEAREKAGEALIGPLPKAYAELRLGWIRQDEGDERKALRHFEIAAGEDDAFWRANFAAARILEAEEPLKALGRYGRVMERNPNHRETHARAVTLVRSRLDPADAGVREILNEVATSLEEARAQGVAAPHIEHTLAFALLHGGDPGRHDEALELAGSAAAAMGDDPDVLATLAEAEHRDGKHSLAVTTLERAVELPGAGEHLERMAAAFRKAALPDLPTYRSIDAALACTAPGGEDRLREEFSAAVADRGPRLLYLDARIDQKAGRLAEAIEGFRAAADADRTRLEPVERLVEAHLAVADGVAAESALGTALATRLRSRRELWKLWARVSFQVLGRTASSALGVLPASGALTGGPPAEADGAADPGADVRWVLEVLAAGEVVRIDCGEDEAIGDGSPWGRDRFFVGGKAAETQVETPGEEGSLYWTQRWFPARGAGAVEYEIPLPAGTYGVTLHFAEVRLPGGRSFDALVEDVAVDGGTPLGETELALPAIRTITVPVVDGLLGIDLVPRKGEPSIAAIEIHRLDG